jgi:hypothetical protein
VADCVKLGAAPGSPAALCVYGFLEGGGFAIANVDSHREALDLMADYPLFGMVTWEVRPLLEFKEGLDTVRAKLAEAQTAMAGG